MQADKLYRLIGDKTSGDIQIKVIDDAGQTYDITDLVVDPPHDNEGHRIAWLKAELEQ